MSNAWYTPFGTYRILQTDYTPLFEKHGVHLVLTGHAHIYERSLKNGVHYVVGGPAGGLSGLFGVDNPYSVITADTPTISQFTADRDRLRMITTDPDGREIDSLTIDRN